MESPPGKKSFSTAIIVVVVLVVVCGGAVSFVGILAAIAIPNFVAMQYRAKRAEVPANVDGIKTAELAYNAAFDQFIPQDDPVPVSAWELGEALVPWNERTGFTTIGWGPDGMVRGTYWVELTDGGEDFIVHGMCDVDGDGEPAHYTATRTTYAVQVTPNSVY